MHTVIAMASMTTSICSDCILPYTDSALSSHPLPPHISPNSDALDGHLLALADEEGSLVLRDCRVPLTHDSSWLVGIGACKNAIFDLAWVPGENKLVGTCAHHLVVHCMCAYRVWVVLLLS